MDNENKLSEIEDLLMGFLCTSNAAKGTQILAFLALGDDDERINMCRYLSDNPDASDKEIMRMAYKLAKPRDDVYIRDPDTY